MLVGGWCRVWDMGKDWVLVLIGLGGFLGWVKWILESFYSCRSLIGGCLGRSLGKGC